nr:hypothetical protein CFP56_79119 [Quercus suber]
MAATQAIEFAGEIGVDIIMVEGDSSTVTKALSTKNPGRNKGENDLRLSREFNPSLGSWFLPLGSWVRCLSSWVLLLGFATGFTGHQLGSLFMVESFV